MILLKNIKAVAFIAILIVLPLYASEKCTFSNDHLLHDKYKENEAVSIFKVFSKTNEVKGVLKNNNVFSAKYWNCNHYGVQAMMIIGPQIETIPEDLNEQTLQLAKAVLSSAELELIKNSLGDKKLLLSSTPEKLYIKSNDYSEFYVSYYVVNDVIFIEIKLYRG